MKRILYGVITVILCITQNVNAQALAELLENIAISSNEKVYFVETRTAYFLDEPLVSKGNMIFKEPSTIIKKFNFPEIMEQHIEGNILSIRHNDGIENTISLESNKELATAINAIRWVLSGNLSALEENFIIGYKLDNKQWTIQLTPKDIEVLDTINKITLAGEDARISQVNVKQSNGDVIKTDLYEDQQ